MTEMSPSFRNIVRISAFAGIVLLIVGFVTNRKSAVPTIKAVHHQSGPVASGNNAPTNVHVQTPTGNERTLSGEDAGVRQIPGEYQQPPGGTGANKPRDQDTLSRIPDLVKYNLDDSSQPRLPRKPASANENEILAKEFLIPGMVPGIIHYLWCGNRWFGFKQYLALDSAVKAIKPDKIIFHLEYLPQGDQVHYHQWWDDIVHDYPFLYVHQIDQSKLDVCNGPIDQRIRRMMRWLDYDGGGIFVSENTWFLDFKPHLRLADLDYALDPGTMNGYLILRAGIGNSTNFSLDSMMANKAVKARYSSCASVHTLQRQPALPAHTACMTVTGAKVYDFLTPMHVWELDTPFGRITRRLYYGTEEILRPKPTYDELVPNIGHMIWIGGGRMDFLFYLSLLSKLFVLKVDVVYIHGDMPPKGEYWEKLKQNKRIFDRVKFITRPPPYRIYQGEIEWYYRALMSDLIRVDIMIKYGGIYTDTDAIWTKPLSYEDRGYDAVASFDWVDWSYPYPDSVNFGLSYGKRNAPFWRIFRNSMRRLHNDVHGFTGVMMPYKLLEKYPHLLRIDKHLMAICYQQKCHPTYIADYHNETNNHVTTNSIPNWQEDLNALHWTHPNPTEYANETTLMAATGMFADVGRFVLKSAGLI